MQTISAYLLERKGLSPEERRGRVQKVHAGIDAWLVEKGVADPNQSSGAFASETPDGGGTFAREILVVDDDYVEVVTLKEKANADQLFITRISVVAKDDRVIVHTSVSAANIRTTIVPRPTSARCPSVVRHLIRDHRDWSVNGAPIPSGRPREYVGAQGGEELCRIITSPKRKFPLILVSEDDEEFVWDGLDKKLAFDLVGLGYVSSIDADAGWEITKRLGRGHACYDGAVRLYWPNVAATAGHVVSTVWTAERMLEAPADANAEDMFREQLRKRVMSVSALAITEPAEVGEIQRANARRKLKELQGNAAEIDTVYALANSLADDLEDANRKLAEQDASISILTTRAENAEAQLAFARGVEPSDPEDANAPENADEDVAPKIEDGQIIFYKKVDAAPHHDIMVRRGDCGHNSWKSAHAADKAWKGVEKVEGRGDWKSFQHCGRCKGGGMWKVTW